MMLASAAGDADVAPVLLALLVILVAAKLSGELFERLKQPAVLGELLVGIVLGNLALVGVENLEFLRSQKTLEVLAELGIILLLFEIGLDTTPRQMLQVGPSALLVALIGVVVPSLLGFAGARYFFPRESTYAHLFVGAILCATSVGITARVLQDLGKTRTPEAKVVIGAAVIDDVLGLIVLAIVSGMILAAGSGRELGAGPIAWIAGKAILFIILSTAAGLALSRGAFRLAGRLRSRGVLLVTSLSFCFLLAYLSNVAGLATIVGAFTAGMIVRNVHFDRLAAREGKSLVELLHPLLQLLLPVFFVSMGFKVDLRAFGQEGVALFSVVLTAAALVGKLVCGVGVLGRGIDRLTVGVGMVPRGEVGLIFAGVGMTLVLNGHPVVNAAIFSGVVIMVMVTTLVTPPLLKWRLGRKTPPSEPEPAPCEVSEPGRSRSH
jgi:Kef-type K+ transport system membrane component KefB